MEYKDVQSHKQVYYWVISIVGYDFRSELELEAIRSELVEEFKSLVDKKIAMVTDEVSKCEWVNLKQVCIRGCCMLFNWHPV